MAAKTNTWASNLAREITEDLAWRQVLSRDWAVSLARMCCHVIQSGLREPTRTERTTARRLPAIFDRLFGKIIEKLMTFNSDKSLDMHEPLARTQRIDRKTDPHDRGMVIDVAV
jgi:hypothetical protein